MSRDQGRANNYDSVVFTLHMHPGSRTALTSRIARVKTKRSKC